MRSYWLFYEHVLAQGQRITNIYTKFLFKYCKKIISYQHLILGGPQTSKLIKMCDFPANSEINLRKSFSLILDPNAVKKGRYPWHLPSLPVSHRPRRLRDPFPCKAPEAAEFSGKTRTFRVRRSKFKLWLSYF